MTDHRFTDAFFPGSDNSNDLERLVADAPDLVAAALTIAEIDVLEADLVGRTSPVAEARKGLGGISDADDRRAAGKAINDMALELQRLVDERRGAVASAEQTADLMADAVDVTLPGRRPRRGTHHVIQQTMDEIVDIFVGLGYTVATGPEAETEFYNFTALNTRTKRSC
jgi:phenylalanyl-tRNA synthetase alpha chain